MSQENVELFCRAVDAFNRRDLDAFLAGADDDVEVFSLLVPMEGGFHGHDGIRRWWESFLDVWPDYNVEIVDVGDLGDLTVGAVRSRGHATGSDVPMDETLWQVARYRRGKCVWWRTFSTRDEALEAVGLSEQDADDPV